MGKIPLSGGAYTAHSVIASAQRSVNLYAEPMPEAQGEPMPAAHYPTPGTRLLGVVGPGPIRGIRQSSTGATYVVSGSNVYVVDTAAWTGTLLGTITAGLKTPVSMADNGLDMVIVDGTSGGWHVTLVGNVFAPIVQSTIVAPVALAATVEITKDVARYTPFKSTIDGFISTATVALSAGYNGNMKCSIFEANEGALPGAVLGSSRVLTNPATGNNTLFFSTPVPVAKDTEYWIGWDSDTSWDAPSGRGVWDISSDVAQGLSSATLYKDFPVASVSAGLVTAPAIVCSINIDSDPDGVFAGADRVDYLDTYLLFNKPNTPQFYSSDSLALTFDPLWFANKESYSDLLQTLIVAKRNIWLMGSVSTEVWANVGKPDFPFESQGDVFIDHGVVAKYSVANYDNGVFWLSRDRQGQGIVIMGAGYQTKRVSTYAIEAEIAGYTTISDAIGYCYQLSGHAFYVLTFPHADKTWSYDITTGLWHEWVWIDTNGDEHRHRSNCYWPVSGIPVVGDWQNGNLYALDQRVFTDNGRPIKRVRSFPHLLNDGKRVFYRQFLADMETGNAPEIPLEVIIPPTLSGFYALPKLAGSWDASAYAIAADGSTIVGYVGAPDDPAHGRLACYWTNVTDPPTVIGTDRSEATGVSGDGSVICGDIGTSGGGTRPFRWTAAGGLVPFGVLNDAAFAISADGSRIVGNTSSGLACFWDSTSLARTDLVGGGIARAISADGSVIVGDTSGANSHAFRWTSGTGLVDLGFPAASTFNVARTYGVSDDGNVVVGFITSPSAATHCFRWTPAAGMVAISEDVTSNYRAISGDGTTIYSLGWYPDIDSYNSPFNVAYTVGGAVTVPPPTLFGASLTAEYHPGLAGSISADGQVMVGFCDDGGFSPPSQAFAYYIPSPSGITIPVASNSLISLRWSDDRGHSWSSPVTQPIGAAGEYRTSLQWQRLGMTRDRNFEISWSVPMACALQGAWIEVTPAQS